MYVIAGVSGNTGSVVAPTLLAAKQPVRVLVRDAAKGEPWRAQGAEVVVADIADQAALTRALTPSARPQPGCCSRDPRARAWSSSRVRPISRCRTSPPRCPRSPASRSRASRCRPRPAAMVQALIGQGASAELAESFGELAAGITSGLIRFQGTPVRGTITLDQRFRSLLAPST